MAEAGIYASPDLLTSRPAAAIPRDYNFADDLFRRFNDRGWSEKPAYVDPRGSWTCRQLEFRAKHFSVALSVLGIRPGERVLMCLTDTIDWPSVFLGTLYGGRVAVPVNTLMTEDDYRFMLKDFGRAPAGGLQGAVAEIRKAPPRIIPIAFCWYPAATIRGTIWSSTSKKYRCVAASIRCRPPATTSRSGSTPQARPASRRRRCMCMPTCA